MAISKAEWEELYFTRMEPRMWWEEIHLSGRYDKSMGAVAPPHVCVLLFVREHFHSYSWFEENMAKHEIINPRLVIGWPCDDETMAPTPYLYQVVDFRHQYHGKRDYYWVEYPSNYDLTRGELEVLYHCSITAQRYNPYQPIIDKRAANAAWGYLSQEDYMRQMMYHSRKEQWSSKHRGITY